MQVVAYCEEKTARNTVAQVTNGIRHFSLQDAFPVGHTLALNLTLGTLSYLSSIGEKPQLLTQQQFTASEMSILLPLLDSHPYYCPYEVLYASFYNGDVTDLIVARCRQRLQMALEIGTWDQEMRPVRNVLSRTRLKLRAFGLNVSSILETGCILMIATSTLVFDEKSPKMR
ncbi:MAG: hypothetical protein M3Y76_10380 [Chloroflexota bacterium]|nr:hypothetical protein [Chloroflexota bacterium]